MQHFRQADNLQLVALFSPEHGFEGKTRDLAKRIGITQPLLYRYFPSKESLVERVYEEVYLQRWNPAWDSLITDRSQPLAERLCRFYTEYAKAVYDYVWVRIFVYSGLKGVDINERYLTIVRDRVLRPVCAELRHESGLAPPDDVPVGEQELELAWGLHGMFFYRAIRHFVYNQPMTGDVDKVIENEVRVFVTGAPVVQQQIIEQANAATD